MSTLKKLFFLVFWIFVDKILRETEASVTSKCTNHSICLETYRDFYNSMGSQENSFNIASTLYHPRKPAPVLVLVYLYTSNQKENSSQALYLWSTSCLYAAIPARILEILSLGSILVTPRTEELYVTVPLFCCSVSEYRRISIIERALYELQDLAVSPGTRDPRLNTAECVIKGHEPNMQATGRITDLQALLWSSFAISIFVGPYFSNRILKNFSEASLDKKLDPNCPHYYLVKAVNRVVSFSMAVEVGLVVTLNSIERFEALLRINSIFVWFIFVGLLANMCLEWSRYFLLGCIRRKRVSTLLWEACVVVLGEFTTFHFCWLVVGIMINPIWGLTVLSVILVCISTMLYSTYIYLASKPSNFCFCLLCAAQCASFLFSVTLLFLLASFAGQSSRGRESLIENLKANSLCLIATVIAYYIWPQSKGKIGEKIKEVPGEGNEDIELRLENVAPSFKLEPIARLESL